MIKRTLYFGNSAYLSLKDSQLVLRYPEIVNNDTLPELLKKPVTVPIEDIGIVVLDNKQITITQALIEALLDNNVALITCNSTHHPTGLLLPLSGNTIQTERFRAQLDATEPLKKQLWTQTVEQKIKNQSAHLMNREIKNDYLIPLYRNVKSGDSENTEGTAAAYYWKNVFTKHNHDGLANFKRFREGASPNNFLNYGYSLLRAIMARSIVGAGLLPTLGIHHRNRYNAYCLADDLMEPYRPMVDNVVCELLDAHPLNEDIPKEIKVELLKIAGMDVMMDGEKSPLMNATQRTAVSLVKCFNGEQRKLLYPEFI
jgi:CRISP-associated protein Cas1